MQFSNTAERFAYVPGIEITLKFTTVQTAAVGLEGVISHQIRESSQLKQEVIILFIQFKNHTFF